MEVRVCVCCTNGGVVQPLSAGKAECYFFFPFLADCTGFSFHDFHMVAMQPLEDVSSLSIYIAFHTSTLFHRALLPHPLVLPSPYYSIPLNFVLLDFSFWSLSIFFFFSTLSVHMFSSPLICLPCCCLPSALLSVLFLAQLLAKLTASKVTRTVLSVWQGAGVCVCDGRVMHRIQWACPHPCTSTECMCKHPWMWIIASVCVVLT